MGEIRNNTRSTGPASLHNEKPTEYMQQLGLLWGDMRSALCFCLCFYFGFRFLCFCYCFAFRFLSCCCFYLQKLTLLLLLRCSYLFSFMLLLQGHSIQRVLYIGKFPWPHTTRKLDDEKKIDWNFRCAAVQSAHELPATYPTHTSVMRSFVGFTELANAYCVLRIRNRLIL